MLQRLVVLTMCICTLAGCVATTPNQDDGVEFVNSVVKTNKDEKKSSTLDAWWMFFNDPVLERLASSAMSLNAYDSVSKNSIVLDVVKNYIQYRYTQNQKALLAKYILDKEDIIEGGKASSDTRVVKIKGQQGNLIKKKIDLKKQEDNISSEIARLTKLLPEYVSQILKNKTDFPRLDITPILASSVSIVSKSPKIMSLTAISDSKMSNDIENIFPDMTIGRFFGVSDDVYLNNNSIWRVSIGSAIKNLNLSELDTQYLADKAYNNFRNNIYKTIINIEKKIVSYAHMQEQYIVLKDAASKYEREFLLLKENRPNNKISFSSISTICDEAYNASLAALMAEYENSKLLVDLYGMLWLNDFD